MKKKVWLSIKGKQQTQDQEAEIIELLTEGELYNKDKSQYILYKESEVSGMEGTTTTVKIEGDQVTIIRLGTTNSHLVFKKGKKKYNRYETPYGDLLMSISTKNVDVEYNEEKDPIAIHLDYNMEIDGAHGSRNTLDIQVKH
ncbi:DUF1934 domain-containing protein [Irregularibacter muris]|uniref:DUF1934 domain-containing protein n=1 Tax=Irregularibacter muris TaxID=1796619 RepID=A0AAE3HF70_9FIRM|nr:DUF1934 domain-containing protein [Irregularibacter muris]MCR1899481.1 DUF1934 domain-containing protein [Irregularibacter muris]